MSKRIDKLYIETRVVDETTIERKCTGCNEFKKLTEFYLKIGCYLGTVSKCKQCLIKKDKLNKLKKFELTTNDYNELLKKGCSICGQLEDLVIDHKHENEKFRGILCRTCNSGLGHFKDDSDLLLKAAAYLDAFLETIKINV